MDKFYEWRHGYENFAREFRFGRNQSIGANEAATWASSLPPKALVADLGCGFGEPITGTIVRAGCRVYAVDASPTLLKTLVERLPDVVVECANVTEANFGGERNFDGVIAWGLLFLLPEAAQKDVIAMAARILRPGGSFLFTSPQQRLEWPDAQTDAPSLSLGADVYRKLLQENGFDTPAEFEDHGGNHYYQASYLGNNRSTSS